ncbi:MAG: small basic protein [Candidatus Omnitrophica bacterium]|nr:small basic protein [Candidatus Omnitrophota bacterium]
MTQHSSLKNASVGTKHRNVLKRHERVRTLQTNEKWNDRQSVYKLPKLKLIKLKVKKAKADKAEETAGTEGGAAGAVPQAKPEAAPKASAKASPEKGKTK